MRTLRIIIAFAVILSTFSCKKSDKQKEDFKPVNLTEKQKLIVAASNEFGFEFFKRIALLADTEKNMMISPLSISMALGMTRNGAANATLDSMNKTLFFSGMSDSEINEAYKTIVGNFSTLDPNVKMQIANSIWNRQGFDVSANFISTNKNYFDAEIASLDFNDPQSVSTINSWVDDKTNHLIDKIINQIPADAVMYLINAIYFKGQWTYQFEKSNTLDKDFYSNAGTLQVPTMKQRADLNYFNGNGFEAVEMPYNQGNFVCTVILPAEGKNVSEITGQMTLSNWMDWQGYFTKRDVQIEIPKFKYEYEENNIKTVLGDMGMNIAFNADLADFSRINAEQQLYISDIKHKTFIESNEEGTEAAAVTSVEVGTTSINPDEPQPVYIKFNRPFVYLITEKSTQTILFIGVVNNPLI